MKCDPRPGEKGFALIIVMIVITVLGILAGTFAYSMKVESRLAANANSDSELQWLGRSGVELARYVLGQSMGQPYTSLNQIWAGGPGGLNESNSVLAEISLDNNQLGGGVFSVKIRDMERKFNINVADQEVLTRALAIIGVEATESPVVVDSILDWRDPDDNPHLSGAESDYYLALTPPYFAKNGPIDDLSELLLVQGVTPALYWGPAAAAHAEQLFQPNARRARPTSDLPMYPVGLADIFTPLSNRQININTASGHVLQLLPGVDEIIASNIIRARSGPDGAEGTEDDTPFTSAGMLNPAVVPGINPQLAGLYGRFCAVASATFEVTVTVRVGVCQKKYYALLRRNSPRDVQILQFSWQ
jgi:general secretion pathway protein K